MCDARDLLGCVYHHLWYNVQQPDG